MKILVVDDSRTIRNNQKSALRQLGHNEIVEAADGAEALAKIAETHPDLMLLDANLPKMDSISLVRKVRGNNAALPIIMCATAAEKSRVVEAIKAGVSNFVVKPFTTEALAEKINQTMARTAAAAAEARTPADQTH